ncbi:MAG: DUF6486 family protein [Prevotella sp.]|nr:DUF6486 family protein [Prevotella sp.]
MKWNKIPWMRIWQIVAAAITAAITALTTTSCMGRGPF